MSGEKNLGYLGVDFQYRLLNQLINNKRFSESVLSILDPNYFSDKNLRLIAFQIRKSYEKYNDIPDIQSLKISFSEQIKDEIQKDFILSQLDKVQNTVINSPDQITNITSKFCKQQELSKSIKKIQEIIDEGNVDRYDECLDIIRKAVEFSDDENKDINVTDNLESVLDPDFRSPIPTGIRLLDQYMNGGLSRSELGVLLAAYGVGKTTFAVKVCNNAFNEGYNVIQIFFEDKEDIIKRKHISCWTGIELNELSDRKEEVLEILKTKIDNNRGNSLLLKKFPSDGTTINKIRKYIKRKISQGFNPDLIVLDYIDCVDTEKRIDDPNVSQGKVMREFESMLEEFNCAGWTFVQGNRSAIKSAIVEGDQMGGSIKRGQIAHFLCSAAKTLSQREEGKANFAILKSRIGNDGVIFEDILFDNKRVMIDIDETNNQMSFMDKKNVDVNKMKDKVFDILERAKKNQQRN